MYKKTLPPISLSMPRYLNLPSCAKNCLSFSINFKYIKSHLIIEFSTSVVTLVKNLNVTNSNFLVAYGPATLWSPVHPPVIITAKMTHVIGKKQPKSTQKGRIELIIYLRYNRRVLYRVGTDDCWALRSFKHGLGCLDEIRPKRLDVS